MTATLLSIFASSDNGEAKILFTNFRCNYAAFQLNSHNYPDCFSLSLASVSCEKFFHSYTVKQICMQHACQI